MIKKILTQTVLLATLCKVSYGAVAGSQFLTKSKDPHAVNILSALKNSPTWEGQINFNNFAYPVQNLGPSITLGPCTIRVTYQNSSINPSGGIFIIFQANKPVITGSCKFEYNGPNFILRLISGRENTEEDVLDPRSSIPRAYTLVFNCGPLGSFAPNLIQGKLWRVYNNEQSVRLLPKDANTQIVLHPAVVAAPKKP